MQSPKVIQVNVLDDFELLLEFENGERKVFDVKPYIHGDFMSELADKRYFSMVRPKDLSIAWPNGQDLCPDVLYEDGKAVK